MLGGLRSKREQKACRCVEWTRAWAVRAGCGAGARVPMTLASQLLRRMANEAIERTHHLSIEERSRRTLASDIGHACDLAVSDLAAHPREDWESCDAVRAFLSVVRRVEGVAA